ncbi:MAG: hypothetical protein R2787_06235 [Saprospiraceae bacterium]
MVFRLKIEIIILFFVGIMVTCSMSLLATGSQDSIDFKVRPNPVPSLNYIQSNAFGLEKGHGYFQNDMLLFSQAGYGLSNSFMVQGGFVFLHFIDLSAAPFWISTKWHTGIRNHHALSISSSVIGFFGKNPWQGVLLGNYTYRNTFGHLTVGAGYTMAYKGNAEELPILQLSGQFSSIGKNEIVIVENYLTPIDKGRYRYSLLLGWRWIRKSVHWQVYLYGGAIPQISFAFNSRSIENGVFPMVGVVVPFK